MGMQYNYIVLIVIFERLSLAVQDLDENLRKRKPAIMDVTNNEENGSNVVANEPQKNEEEVAEKVKTSDGKKLTS